MQHFVSHHKLIYLQHAVAAVIKTKNKTIQQHKKQFKTSFCVFLIQHKIECKNKQDHCFDTNLTGYDFILIQVFHSGLCTCVFTSLTAHMRAMDPMLLVMVTSVALARSSLLMLSRLSLDIM